jgi:diguanylate cyclase (GGDEF)-like protein
VLTQQPIRVSDQLDRRQALRLRRLLISVAVYLPCAILLYLVAWLGFLPQWFTPFWFAVFAAANLIFFGLIKSGLNLRFKDPSMTMAQMAVAIGAVALILYHAQAARGALLMFLLVILFFGTLRLNTAEVLAMGVLCSAAYGAVILLLSARRPQQVDVRVEWVQWIALTATLAVLCPLVGYLSDVRWRLSESLRTIREMAHRDALTGVFNRHHLVDTLEREIGRCERAGPAFLLLLVDIDHFKRINDTRGHLVGDEALRVVARELHEGLRKSDYLARYGGEEFVLIVSTDGVEGARVACERIRKRVETLRIAPLGGAGVTVSIGGSFYRQGDTSTSILARADGALYQAKNKGRNVVELDLALDEPPVGSNAQAQAG